MRIIGDQLLELDKVIQNGGDKLGIDQEQWYVRGKEAIKDCEFAISRPKEYLLYRGQMHHFINDVKGQNAKGILIGKPVMTLYK
ncbi:MAG: hypothetical protein NVV82_21055 [Sporocytophaga sp.]|nr:hypothetical protein [Sporocytophaga sp.]